MLLDKVGCANISDVGVLQQQQALSATGNQHIIITLLNRELPNADTTKNNAVGARNLDRVRELMGEEES